MEQKKAEHEDGVYPIGTTEFNRVTYTYLLGGALVQVCKGYVVYLPNRFVMLFDEHKRPLNIARGRVTVYRGNKKTTEAALRNRNAQVYCIGNILIPSGGK